MKLLVVVSSLDLTQSFSATPAWWQLLKGLYEIGVEVIATPYQGPSIESLWWRAESNPARLQGNAFRLLRDIVRVVKPPRQVQMEDTRAVIDDQDDRDSLSNKTMRTLAQTFVAPLWRRHLERLLLKEPDIDAIMFINIPLNQIKGVARYVSERFQKPIFYFDGDVPASLPNMKGFASGFHYYQGADVTEFTAFISNSKGGEDFLYQLGVKNAHTCLVWCGY